MIYRHQVLKQSDIVLAQVLLSSEFTTAEKKRNFDYYDPLTTGDSSLSPPIQSVAAAELGYADVAYRYFMQTARMDLDDINGNVSHGVHVAAMAGSWVSLVYGFAGLRDDDGAIAFSPRLPGHGIAWRSGSSSAAPRWRSRSPVTPSATRPSPAMGWTSGISVGRSPSVLGAPVQIGLDPSLQAVIFDLDGVITDTAEHHYQAWQRLAAEIVAAVRPGAQRAAQGRQPDGEPRHHPRERGPDGKRCRQGPPRRPQERLLPRAHRPGHRAG